MTDINLVTVAPGVVTVLRCSFRPDLDGKQPHLFLNRILAELLVRNNELVKGLVASPHDILFDDASFLSTMQHGDPGQALDEGILLEELKQDVASLGKTTAYEKDLARLILRKAGIPLAHPALSPPSSAAQSACAATPLALNPAHDQSTIPKKSKSVPKITTLLEVGRNLTREAQEGKLSPVIGRDRELQEIIETLCRLTKRNPLLVGPAGVGKTAIVEGLALSLVNNLIPVPEILRDVTVILLQPSLIVAGNGQIGALEKRMKSILAEAAQEGVILFIDEVHCIVGAGGSAGTGDIASLMKPALARGDIACIAATTDDEYRLYIEKDSALERRFNVVAVQEMSYEEAFEVLKSVRDNLQQLRGVSLDDAVLQRLMDYATQFMRNRTFPDKGIDLLEQCFANAMVRGDTEVDCHEADTIVQRKFGIPVDLENRLDKVQSSLTLCSYLKDSAVTTLLDTLNVSMRGLDSRDVRPNAVLLLTGAAAREADNIAECLSSALFETADRVVKIDLGRMFNPSDITLLLGSPPSFVGHGEKLPIHRIKQFPWSIVLFENIDKCGAHIQQVIAQAFKDGYFVDGQSRKIFVSDVIAILTASGIDSVASHTIGFGRDLTVAKDAGFTLAKKYLETALLDAINLVVSELSPSNSGTENSNLHLHTLDKFIDRYNRQGIKLHYDDSLLSWINENRQQNGHGDLGDLLDKNVSPPVLAYIKSRRDLTAIHIKCLSGQIIVEE